MFSKENKQKPCAKLLFRSFHLIICRVLKLYPGSISLHITLQQSLSLKSSLVWRVHYKESQLLLVTLQPEHHHGLKSECTLSSVSQLQKHSSGVGALAKKSFMTFNSELCICVTISRTDTPHVSSPIKVQTFPAEHSFNTTCFSECPLQEERVYNSPGTLDPTSWCWSRSHWPNERCKGTTMNLCSAQT